MRLSNVFSKNAFVLIFLPKTMHFITDTLKYCRTEVHEQSNDF